MYNPQDIRQLIENGENKTHTSGLCPGFAQANILMLQAKYVEDFCSFAEKNKKACPILEVGDPGSRKLNIAKNSDIYKCLPKYLIYKNGVMVKEDIDISKLFSYELCAIALGCSFTFESELIESGIELRHIRNNKNVAMYNTSIKMDPSKYFSGTMVVSMRPIKKSQVDKVIEITSHYPDVHGEPIHIGNPEEIGIKDINTLDYGDFVEIMEDEIPVFWACGVSSHNAIINSEVDFFITHKPGHMLITDIKNKSLWK